MTKRVMVTGASGFLGSAITYALVKKGYKTSVLLRRESTIDKMHSVSQKIDISRFESLADIPEVLTELNPDIVIHTACSYGRTGEKPAEIEYSNVSYGLAIIEGLEELSKEITFINTGTVLNYDINLYACTKQHFSELGRLISEDSKSNIKFIDIALQHMFGPNDSPTKFATYVIQQCLKNDHALELTSGTQLRDFIFVDDAVDAYIKLVEEHNKLPKTIKIDLGSGKSISIRNFVEKIHQMTGSSIELGFGKKENRKNNEENYISNPQYLRGLGWQPQFTLREGLVKTISAERDRK